MCLILFFQNTQELACNLIRGTVVYLLVCVMYWIMHFRRACIDTSERGALEEGVHLGEYSITHQWASLTPADQYNISVNVHNDGNILEIVGMCCKLV